MMLSTVLTLVHVLGLVLGVGAATVKLTLLLRCARDEELVHAYMAVAGPITRLIVIGLALLTVSGVGWFVVGRPFDPLVLAKLAVVAGVWMLGPLIDKAIEPRFRALAPRRGERPSSAYGAARRRFVAVEAAATGLFYGATVLGVLM